MDWSLKGVTIGGMAVIGAYHVAGWLYEKIAGEPQGHDFSGLFTWEPPAGRLRLEDADEADQEDGMAFYVFDDDDRGFGEVFRADGGYVIRLRGARGYGDELVRSVGTKREILPAVNEMVAALSAQYEAGEIG
jgi:hypothetical protein